MDNQLLNQPWDEETLVSAIFGRRPISAIILIIRKLCGFIFFLQILHIWLLTICYMNHNMVFGYFIYQYTAITDEYIVSFIPSSILFGGLYFAACIATFFINRNLLKLFGLSEETTQSELEDNYVKLCEKYDPEQFKAYGYDFQELAHLKLNMIEQIYNSLQPNGYLLNSPQSIQILNVKRDATIDQIAMAYEELSSKYHPQNFSHLENEFVNLAFDHYTGIRNAYFKLKNKHEFQNSQFGKWMSKRKFLYKWIGNAISLIALMIGFIWKIKSLFKFFKAEHTMESVLQSCIKESSQQFQEELTKNVKSFSEKRLTKQASKQVEQSVQEAMSVTISNVFPMFFESYNAHHTKPKVSKNKKDSQKKPKSK